MLFPQLLTVSSRKTKAFGRRFVVVLALSAGPFTPPAVAESGGYVPYSGIIRGTQGAEPVEISIANETGTAIDCLAALAHWYSDELGRIAPQDALTLTLWRDTTTGVLNLMNETDDRMPLEALWCSAGDARTRIDLPITAGKIDATLRYSCRSAGDAGLSCEAAGG